MCRPVTSGVSALSGCVAKGHQALHYVSSSPSKIPYGGFSPVRLQTASLHRNLRQPGQPGSLYAINGPVGLRLLSARTVSGWRETAPDPAVQRPLARRRVILSRQVIAYYGLIRASRSLSPSYVLRQRVFADWPGPRGSPIYSACPFCPCRLPYPGGPVGGLTVPSPSVLAFTQSRGARHPRVLHASRFVRGMGFRGCKVRFMLRPGQLLALHRHRTFTFELSSPESPPGDVEYNYAGKQSIPAAGLAPAGHAALWAATRFPG